MPERKPTAVVEPEASEPLEAPDEVETATRESLWVWLRGPLLFFGGVLSVIVSITAVWGLNFLRTVGEGIQPIDPVKTTELSDPWDFGKRPRNVLVLGSDSRAGLSEEEQAAFGTEETVGGERSDTIILMSIDPRREQAVVVHFPRDLRVAIPGHGTDKINAAFEYGGPNLVIRTIKGFTGLPVHNYMQIDLAGFERLVDTVGGVRICVDRAMHDPLAGLDIPKAGCYQFDGQEALAFVRARHVEGDLIPDFSRIRRQQQFMRAMMNKLFSLGSLLDDETIREAVGAVETDAGLTATDLIELGRRLRQLAQEDPSGAESLDLRVIPGDTATIGEVSYVIATQPETRQLFERMEQGRNLGTLGQDLALTLPTPAIVRVRVMPVGLEDGSDAEALLKRAGFVVLPSRGAYGVPGKTEIVYKSGSEDRARVVQGYFPGLRVREVPSVLLDDAEVGVVIGDDYTSPRGEDG